MNGTRSKADLLTFLDYLANKGLVPLPTIQNRKAAVNAVLGALDDHEVEDVSKIDVDEVMVRFSNLHGSKYTPDSMSTYKSRLRSSIDDFVRYQQNPLGFKPTTSAIRKRKPVSGQPGPSPSLSADVTNEPASPAASSPRPSVDATILPIPIRPNLIVFIQGIPHDLTRAEAAKIANVVKAMASDGTE